jgi:hypothetical protein
VIASIAAGDSQLLKLGSFVRPNARRAIAMHYIRPIGFSGQSNGLKGKRRTLSFNRVSIVEYSTQACGKAAHFIAAEGV